MAVVQLCQGVYKEMLVKASDDSSPEYYGKEIHLEDDSFDKLYSIFKS